MAHLTRRHPQNISGDFYVDSTCIDCDTCRWMAPTVFKSSGDQSVVYHQPKSLEERQQALQALLSCPTASIGTVKPPKDIKLAQESLPTAITAGIYHCGYHSEDSYGAASYLIQRPDGNVLVDSPRFTSPLVKQLEALGGVRYLYLTHRDDVADHRKFHDHFGCQRILHADEISHSTQDVEIQLKGSDPVLLEADLQIIPVPGHTKGHTVLLYQNVLFTGDHLAWSPALGHLHAFRRACWYSWPALIGSMKTLLDYSFEWVLPGHGRRYHADADTMHYQLLQCIAWMETVA